ncbi:hypothetical protein [Vibrio sp. 16]|uniref:hypothetical protein n=1 Tax=Vibrio sp. 16 TaxID=391586 RepID=UPI0005C516D4|nr:hypothetical protein [Vibrio sp. 16]
MATARARKEKVELTGGPELRETLSLIESAANSGQLAYKVVHQRIDGNGSLGKLTITDYKQENIKVPTI